LKAEKVLVVPAQKHPLTAAGQLTTSILAGYIGLLAIGKCNACLQYTLKFMTNVQF